MSTRPVGYVLPEEVRGTLLDSIIDVRLRQIEASRQKLPESSLKMALERAPEIRPFKRALERRTPAIIAEIKRASPSAGLLRSDFQPSLIGSLYEESGAAALSVVTEGEYFKGGLEVLAGLRWTCRLPLLRKDFVLDRYQIYEARYAGADAVLLIAALLDPPTLTRFREEIESSGMDALVEVHNEKELDRALEAGATLIGVNNRDLRTFAVSLEVSLSLARRIPRQALGVAESGIHSADDLHRLQDAGYRAFLIGELFMRAPSPGEALARLLKEVGTGRRRSE